MEAIQWFTIGWVCGFLVMAGFTFWLVKKMLRGFYGERDREYTKYIKPKYEVKR